MPNSKRLTILNEAEVKDIYGVPSLSLEEKRVSFVINDMEQDIIQSIRDRRHKCYAIALRGYFKIKPIQLNPSYKELQEDLDFIAKAYFPKYKVPRSSISRFQKTRIYDKILHLLDFKTWDVEQHHNPLTTYLQQLAVLGILPSKKT
jgi:hypothetical protein